MCHDEAPAFMPGSLICQPSCGLQAAFSRNPSRGTTESRHGQEPSFSRKPTNDETLSRPGTERPKDRASRANEAPRPEGRGFKVAPPYLPTLMDWSRMGAYGATAVAGAPPYRGGRQSFASEGEGGEE